MNLKRTTIVPLDDQELARTLFTSFIDMEMMILMVILGDNETIREAIPKADNLATLEYHGMKRWVFWVRNHAILEAELKEYLDKSDADDDMAYEDIKCLCFSPISDEVAGIIHKNGTLSYASLNLSFFRAHAHDSPLSES